MNYYAIILKTHDYHEYQQLLGVVPARLLDVRHALRATEYRNLKICKYNHHDADHMRLIKDETKHIWLQPIKLGEIR